MLFNISPCVGPNGTLCSLQSASHCIKSFSCSFFFTRQTFQRKHSAIALGSEVCAAGKDHRV